MTPEERRKAESEVEREKLLYRAVVAPNLSRWFNSKLVACTYVDKDRNQQTTKCLAFDYTTEGTDYQGKKVTNHRSLVIVVEGKANTYNDRHTLRKELEKVINLKNRTVTVETLKTASTHHSVWNREALGTVLSLASEQPGYKELEASLDIDKIVQKATDQRSKQKEYTEKKRAVKFTLTDQKRIARVLLNLVIQKTDNYLLKVLEDRVPADAADTSGQTLADAMDIFSLKKEDIINALLSANHPDARRFAALFADNAIVALIDKDKSVRLAAKARQSQKKEKTDASSSEGPFEGSDGLGLDLPEGSE